MGDQSRGHDITFNRSTSLSMSLISLAKLVSEVWGRVEYSELDSSFFPPSLYLIWLNPQQETQVIFSSWIYSIFLFQSNTS